MAEKKPKSDKRKILNLFVDENNNLVGGYGTTGRSKYEILLEKTGYRDNIIVIGIYENRVMEKVDSGSRFQMIKAATSMEFHFVKPADSQSSYEGILSKVKIRTSTMWNEDFMYTVRATPLLADLFGIVWEAENVKISFKHKPLEKLIGNYYVARNTMIENGKKIIKDHDTI